MAQETIGWMACYKLSSGQDACYGALFASLKYAVAHISATVAISSKERAELMNEKTVTFERSRKHKTWGEFVVSCHVKRVIDEDN